MPTSVALSTVDIAQKLREYQEKGAKTKKFGYKGSPKDRTIFLSANQKAISWTGKRGDRVFQLQELKLPITVGQRKSKPFARFSKVPPAEVARSVSLWFGARGAEPERTVDLMFTLESEAHTFRTCIEQAVEVAKDPSKRTDPDDAQYEQMLLAWQKASKTAADKVTLADLRKLVVDIAVQQTVLFCGFS